MCGIELMFYSECFGSRGPRALAGGKKTCSPERFLFSFSSFSFSFSSCCCWWSPCACFWSWCCSSGGANPVTGLAANHTPLWSLRAVLQHLSLKSGLAGVSWKLRGSALGQGFLCICYSSSKSRGAGDVLMARGMLGNGGCQVFPKHQRSGMKRLLLSCFPELNCTELQLLV